MLAEVASVCSDTKQRTDAGPLCAQCKTATVTTLTAETPITGGATKSISAASLVNGLYGRRRSLRSTFGL